MQSRNGIRKNRYFKSINSMSLDTVITHNTIQPAAAAVRPDACALVLMGGGARTAYQAGELKAVAQRGAAE